MQIILITECKKTRGGNVGDLKEEDQLRQEPSRFTRALYDGEGRLESSNESAGSHLEGVQLSK